MVPSVIVWDLETIPDLTTFAAVKGLHGLGDTEVREELGEKFPKHIFHSIICIGALIARLSGDKWIVDAVGAPSVAERTEKELICAFVGKIAELRPQLVTFNGASFDLPVLRYRAMIHGIAAPALSSRPYFKRYSTDALDLCDELSSFSSGAKVKLDEISKALGFAGKPTDIQGGDVEAYFRAGRISEIANYCESDVINTYRVWLRYELFCGRLSLSGYEASEASLISYLMLHADTKPHFLSSSGGSGTTA